MKEVEKEFLKARLIQEDKRHKFGAFPRGIIGTILIALLLAIGALCVTGIPWTNINFLTGILFFIIAFIIVYRYNYKKPLKKSIKKFLEPTALKILFFIIIFLLIPAPVLKLEESCPFPSYFVRLTTEPSCDYVWKLIPFSGLKIIKNFSFQELIYLYSYFQDVNLYTSLKVQTFLLLSIIYILFLSYFFSCLLSFLLKPKTHKDSFKDMLLTQQGIVCYYYIGFKFKKGVDK